MSEHWMRVTWADDTLPHQIRLVVDGNQIYLTCTCSQYRRHLESIAAIENARLIYVAEHESQLSEPSGPAE